MIIETGCVFPNGLKSVPNAVYVIGGTGEHISELRELVIAMGVVSSVRFLGEVTDELLPDVYNLAEVFIMANRVLPGSNDVEGFGSYFSKPMHVACRSSVAGHGGVPDAICDGVTGLLVDGASHADVTDAVVRILTDSELARTLGQAGRERVCNELTWAHSAKRIKSLVAAVRR